MAITNYYYGETDRLHHHPSTPPPPTPPLLLLHEDIKHTENAYIKRRTAQEYPLNHFCSSYSLLLPLPLRVTWSACSAKTVIWNSIFQRVSGSCLSLLLVAGQLTIRSLLYFLAGSRSVPLPGRRKCSTVGRVDGDFERRWSPACIILLNKLVSSGWMVLGVSSPPPHVQRHSLWWELDCMFCLSSPTTYSSFSLSS